ncbi:MULTISPECIES: hypothetical protein [unclassified Methanoculleus]|uniref:hypothetical protein n=1 Tax=unclassified Methanoculleus TaxID=2619537 RepID=UPI0025D5D39E|nr:MULTISPECIES: hypothetical protein [unclassified Methanoculleus]MCK9317455.1 DUF2238 domain-containing protein [Methanoculleus sp.]MDD2252993.1 hypothetical protein [Methanoculleus sp.]MDD2788741.1 hypothetical protein [Methanoculleus sp.]MDD3215968.1 hypothetical protein [Methanoculleus sp.]MDD4313718.1 hypothetical protein [Methanoculleus sp.]
MQRPAGLYLACLFQVLIAANILIAFSLGEYSQVFGGVVGLCLTLVPAVVTRRWSITLPWQINLLIAFLLYLHVAGEIQGFYLMYYPYYDKIAHLIAGITVSILAFVIVLLLDRFSRLNLSRWMIVGFIVIAAMAMEGFWEIYEWLFDTFLGTNLQHGLDDTMLDMIFVLIGSVAVALAGNRYLAEYSKEEIAGRLVAPEPGREEPPTG